jgi:hypothetical protein
VARAEAVGAGDDAARRDADGGLGGVADGGHAGCRGEGAGFVEDDLQAWPR